MGTKRTAFCRDGSTRSVGSGPVAFEHEQGRPASVWRDLFYRRVSDDLVDTVLMLATPDAKHPKGHAVVCRALGVDLDGTADEPARLALRVIGVTSTRIVHDGKQWRLPISGADEPTVEALVVPVGSMGPYAVCLALIGRHDFERESDLSDIGDLVAIPLDGSDMVSFGDTVNAIGMFAGVNGTVRLACSGLAWLRRHVERARALGAQFLEYRFDLPDRVETLVLNVRAYNWRLDSGSFPFVARRVLVADRADISEYIAGELRKRDPLPKGPQIIGPKQ